MSSTGASYTVAHYEVLGKLGEGGMGQVWKARDIRLGRTVALKVLNGAFAEDPEFRRRFLREAKAISVLNHPNVCTLFDIGEESGMPFLVMEFLEGESLAARLQQGPLPAPEALHYAAQIADALEAAHRAGIVHRDLKPGNVLLVRAGARLSAKLLDFGLAKIVHPDAAASDASAPLTRAGIVMGTLNYMAPEQIQGKPLDARADLFAFGALLYEMLTGTKAFRGESQSAVMSAILSADPPPVSALTPISPPEVDRLVQRCLAKDPDQRYQSAKDLFAELAFLERQLNTPASRPAQPPPPARTPKLAWAAAALALTLGAAGWAFAGWLSARAPVQNASQPVEFSVTPPPGESLLFTGLAAGTALSPDGRRLAFVTTRNGVPVLAVRPLDSLDPVVLAGTEGASFPFWSPDGRRLAFFASGKLCKMNVAGGAPIALAPAPVGRGGSWTPDGAILFTADATGSVFEIPEAGGEPVRLTQPNPSRKEDGHFWPQVLPDGKRFLYLARSVERGGSHIEVAQRGVEPQRQQPVRLLRANHNAAAAAGQLFFLAGESLQSQPFDWSTLKPRGPARTLAAGLGTLIHINYAGFSVAPSGILAFRPGGQPTSRLVWFDRNGGPPQPAGDEAVHVAVRLAPDGVRAVTATAESLTGISDLWLHDLPSAAAARVTFDAGRDFSPVWSPAGDQIAFASTRNGPSNLYVRAAAGSSASRRLTDSPHPQRPTDWARDGRLIYEETNPTSGRDLWIVPADASAKPVAVSTSGANEVHARFSPDGRWIAFASDESGRYEIYIRDFPFTGAQWQVSSAGGSHPVWRGDGQELFFLSSTGDLHAAPLTPLPGGGLRPGKPARLFTLATGAQAWADHRYDVSRDGRRILVLADTPNRAPAALTLRLAAF
ncbi:MAG: protein kinase [Bryobacteraceae bacterium]|nr:protein kinase [Bryobacteraceae bacterium]